MKKVKPERVKTQQAARRVEVLWGGAPMRIKAMAGPYVDAAVDAIQAINEELQARADVASALDERLRDAVEKFRPGMPVEAMTLVDSLFNEL